MASPHVNYERVAGDYATNRTPTDSRRSIWGRAVEPYLRRALLAVDLAAGTGGFSAALRVWGAGEVVAVEPSHSMRSTAPRTAGVCSVGGRAEAIPLRNGIAGFIWISTALHHFQDRDRAARECRRVLGDDGHVAVRGFVPGHTPMAWLDQFPGSAKAIARFPDLDSMHTTFTKAGFRIDSERLIEEGEETYAQRADFCERMQHADSLLTALTDDEIESGLAALRSRPDRIEPFALSLVVYRAT